MSKFLDGQTFEYRGDVVRVKLSKYVSKRLRVDIVNEDSVPYATLTVNIPEQSLKDREIIVKTWSENEGIATEALRSGLFKNTGVKVPATFASAEIWQVADGYELPKD